VRPGESADLDEDVVVDAYVEATAEEQLPVMVVAVDDAAS
jgi:hypothetical protein